MKMAPIPHKRLIKLLVLVGYFPARQKGSHIILENPKTRKITIVPARAKDVGVGLISRILREIGLPKEDYFNLLEKV